MSLSSNEAIESAISCIENANLCLLDAMLVNGIYDEKDRLEEIKERLEKILEEGKSVK